MCGRFVLEAGELTTLLLDEVGALPAGGLHVRLGHHHRPLTLRLAALRQIEECLSGWERRGGLRWVAFTAASPTTFLAGADFRELGRLSPHEAFAFSRAGQRLMRRLRESPLWLVACVEGACMGGGLDFALACDYRLASPGARFAHPGPRLGLFTGWGGTAVLPHRSAGAPGDLLAGRTLAAREAHARGWVEEVASDPLDRAVRRARASASLDLPAVKRLRRAEGLPLSLALPYEARLALEPPRGE